MTTLLAENVGADYAEHGDEHGKVRLWHLGHRIGIFQSLGNLVEPHVEFVIGYFAKHIERYPRPWFAFGNWTELDAYAPVVRTSMTAWQQEMRYEGLYVAHRSRLVSMGVNIANAVLPTTIKVVATEEELDDLLIEVRKRVGV